LVLFNRNTTGVNLPPLLAMADALIPTSQPPQYAAIRWDVILTTTATRRQPFGGEES